jgi:hypothetical protein
VKVGRGWILLEACYYGSAVCRDLLLVEAAEKTSLSCVHAWIRLKEEVFRMRERQLLVAAEVQEQEYLCGLARDIT